MFWLKISSHLTRVSVSIQDLPDCGRKLTGDRLVVFFQAERNWRQRRKKSRSTQRQSCQTPIWPSLFELFLLVKWALPSLWEQLRLSGSGSMSWYSSSLDCFSAARAGLSRRHTNRALGPDEFNSRDGVMLKAQQAHDLWLYSHLYISELQS